MITHESVDDDYDYGVVHTIQAAPDYAPPVVLEVVHHQGWYYVTRKPWNRRHGRPTNSFSRHSREDLALRAALKKARRYEAAYAVDRSRGRFKKGGET